ncbi:hypothetical protein SSP531S_39270 [Streptomyces spongiicola]|uniref:Uncharacterized protein n=1 Tax=Streptomyces spongiicola TaxID=1690221 RepID=A0A388T0L8_9ACTN|nr:hypothetical protein SSP531S_39270 [Streptomyces spongiicola]
MSGTVARGYDNRFRAGFRTGRPRRSAGAPGRHRRSRVHRGPPPACRRVRRDPATGFGAVRAPRTVGGERDPLRPVALQGSATGTRGPGATVACRLPPAACRLPPSYLRNPVPP